jgi:hypothetical protein
MHMEWYNYEQVNQCDRYGIIINNLKCQIGLDYCNRLVETSTPLQQACRDDQNGYIIRLLWSSDERDMQKISCGPGGTHTRAHGDVLSHKSPRGHDTSSIQRSTLLTNQEQARRSMGPQPWDNWLETLQSPHTHHRTHLVVTWMKIGIDPQVGRPHLEAFCATLPCVSLLWWTRGGAKCLLEYPFEILQILLMGDSPTWPPLVSAMCHHLIGALVAPQGSLDTSYSPILSHFLSWWGVSPLHM